jgi:hypothetical protein
MFSEVATILAEMSFKFLGISSVSVGEVQVMELVNEAVILQLAPQNFTNINIIFNIRLSIALFWMSA